MKAFQHEQLAFVAALRQPQSAALPHGICAERMAVYQRLVFNNIASLLARGLPLCQKILTQTGQWQPLVGAFINSGSQLRSPYFSDLSAAMVKLLQRPTAAVTALSLPAFCAELAHYEWLELAAQIAPVLPPSESPIPVEPLDEAAWLETVFTTAATLQLGRYHWPVMSISTDPAQYQPLLDAGPSSEPLTIAVYRDRREQVRFNALNPLTAALLEQLHNTAPSTLRDQLTTLAGRANHPPLALLIEHAPALIRQFYHQDLVSIRGPEQES